MPVGLRHDDGMNSKNLLAYEFNRLENALPQRVQKSEILGFGHFGVVIGHPDLTVSKFLFRENDLLRFESNLHAFYHEARVLKAFAGLSDRTIEVPTLVSDVEEIYSDEYAATYRMTRIEGQNGGSHYNATSPELATLRGALTAKFHRTICPDLPMAPDKDGYDGRAILCIPNILSDKTNKALEKANSYLQEHKKPGLVHGDLGAHNTIFRDGKPVGLIDFSFTGIGCNQYADFCNVDDHDMEKYIGGYEVESGKTVDRYLIEATALSMSVLYLARMAEFYPDNIVDGVEHVNAYLNNLTYVTGFKP